MASCFGQCIRALEAGVNDFDPDIPAHKGWLEEDPAEAPEVPEEWEGECRHCGEDLGVPYRAGVRDGGEMWEADIGASSYYGREGPPWSRPYCR